MRTNGRRQAGRLLTSALVALALAGCGTSDTHARTEGPTSTTAPATGDARQVAVRINTMPGFTTADFAFSDIPEVTVYADGTVVTIGAQTQEYPGPALPPVITGTITDEQVQQLVAAARAGGVHEPPPDFGMPPVADAPSTKFVVHDNGNDVTVTVNALAYEANGAGLTPAQVEARKKLSDFQKLASDVVTQHATQRFTPTSLTVLVRDASATGDTGTVEPKPADVDWPGDNLVTHPSTEKFGARCLRVTGNEFSTVYPAVQKARANAHWHSGAKTFLLTFRVELRDETGC